MTKYQTDLDRIVSALEAGGEIYRSRSIGTVHVDKKTGGAPVTDVEREVNEEIKIETPFEDRMVAL